MPPTLDSTSTRAALLLALASAALAQEFTVPRPLPGDLELTRPGGRALETDIAAGSARHLAVWVDGRSGLGGIASVGGYSVWGKEDVMGRLVEADGTPAGEPFLLAKLPFEARRPRVAWNGADAWLVVWEARRATQTTTFTGIRGVRVAADGTLLDEVPLVIDDTHGVNERFADVAGAGGEWLAVWADHDLVTNHVGVAGAIVDADGSVVSRRMLGSSTSGLTAPSYPSVEAAAGRFLVAWEHLGSASPGYIVHGQLFDAGLAALGPEFPIGLGSSFGANVQVASNGASFLVSWGGRRAAAVSATGAVTPPGGRTLALASTAYTNHSPAAWVQDRWMVTATNLDGHVLVEELDAQAGTLASAAVLDRDGRTQDSAVAAIGDRAVVAWCEDVLEHADASCARVEVGPAAGPVHALDASAPFQLSPDVDGDPQRGYLVAWLDANSGVRRILAQRLDPAGRPASASPVVIAEGPATALGGPRVARGTSEYLVVWEARDGTGAPRVHGKRISPLGAVLDPAPLDLLPGNTPDVDFEGGLYLVASTHEPTNHYRPVIATRVSSAGLPLDAPHLPIGGSYSRSPRLASTGGRFLGVWSKYASHDSPYSFTQANFVDPSGSVGAPFAVESAASSTRGGRVAAGNGEFLVTFAYDDDVWARALLPDGTLLGSPGGVHLTYAPGTQYSAAALPQGSGWITAWTDYRVHPPLEAGIGDVYGGRLDAQEALLDLDGIAISAGPWVEGDVALAGDETGAVLVMSGWSESHQALRVHVARMAPDQIGTRFCSPAVPNSTGSFASVTARGSDRAFDNDVDLFLEGAPPGTLGYFIASETQTLSPQPGGSQGTLCLGGQVARFAAFVFSVDPAGGAVFSPDLTSIPLGPGIPAFPGETWSFQAWFRDANPGATSNFSDALALTLR